MFIDSHCHLFYEDFNADIGEVIARANDAGVVAFVVPATNHETALQAIALTDQYPNLFVCAGFHPLDLDRFSEEHFSAVREMLGHPRVVAVGEIGIDYFYDRSPREFQKEIFSRHIELAIEYDLPIVVHTRDSVQDAIDMVLRHVAAHPEWMSGNGMAARKRGVFHCFTGTAAQARTLIEHQFQVSFPGPLTFKKSGMPDVLKDIGLEHVMIETDAPFLTPVPYRGKRNEPAHVVLVAQKIAEILNMPLNEVANITSRNAVQLFNLPLTAS
ncbi:MAG: TatD family hydrolase [Bacteroidota bacterium]